MTDLKPYHYRRIRPLAVSLIALMVAAPAMAQQPTPAGAAGQPEISGDVALSMLDIMVQRGLLTQADADKIVAEAKAKAQARAAAQTTAQGMPAGAAGQPAPGGAATTPGGAATSKTADGAVHVQYVPQAVKDEISRDVQNKVMAKAQSEGWAAPNQTPEWTQRIKVSGDVRFRSEEDMFPKGNTLGDGSQVNFAAIQGHNFSGVTSSSSNSAGGTYANSAVNTVPFYNWDKDRERERLRARLAIDADLGSGFTSGMRLATGSDSSAVSTNQTLGGSGGDFSKYQMWLDRAFIKYEPLNTDTTGLAATVGRFANPFFSTDLIWNNDLNFDGVVASGRYQVAKGVTPFVTVGAFPVFDSDLNLSTNDSSKTTSHDKWLLAGQAGTDWKPEKDTAVKVGAGYYFFNNVEGKSVDCANPNDATCGSQYAPSFAQRGNTYFSIRNNPTSAFNSTSTNASPNNYQYWGLATPFHELALTGKVDYDGLKPIFPDQKFRVTMDGEFVKNLAFNKSAINAKDCASGDCWNNAKNGQFNGGDTGVMLRATVGTPTLAQRWDWNASIAYKYLESDAVVDGFNDSDFGMGGTNLKGFILGGNLALSKNVWTTFKWLSADSIAGGTYASDIVFLDINAKF